MKKNFLIILLVFIDQLLKIYIKTHFRLGSGFSIFYFFRIFFIENPGMAYGIHIIPGYYGKVFLSILRFFIVLFILFIYLYNIKKNSNFYLINSIIFILSGSLGNFLDSAFYGLLFDSGTYYDSKYNKWISYSGISKISFPNKGYNSIMKGCVVDMFHLPLINFFIPKYIPIIGGYNFIFFEPIFNLSDIFIFIGIIIILLFNNKINKIIFFKYTFIFENYKKTL
ncbi:lipoprotein signal peptidase [Blattabacterium cuenoti]|uniref:lipoprotein signal peptidase n=1 Tax=Blattabacterium cuenoti TaxID=1653831 RepID=UPI00163D37F1|nr:lipoprotein signal peptidase [Blattabacterium cuenoti]